MTKREEELNAKAFRTAVENFEDETGGFGDDSEFVVRGVIKAYLAALPTPEATEGVELAGEQWRASESGEPATSWYPMGYGDKAGWDALAKRNPEKYHVVTRKVFAVPEATEGGTHESLAAENARLREALKPFASSPYANLGPEAVDDMGICEGVTVGDLRRARAALTPVIASGEEKE